MFIAISHSNRDPMYKQVEDQIKDAIAKGDLESEMKLPSIRELSKELGISPITIKRAYQDLENGGFIVTRSGLGSFVAHLDMAGLRESKVSQLRSELSKIIKTAGSFGIGKDEIARLVDDIEEEYDE